MITSLPHRLLWPRYPYLSRIIGDDEYIVSVSHLHWIAYSTSFVLVVIGGLIGVAGDFLPELFPRSNIADYIALLPLRVLSLSIIAVGTLLFLFVFIRQISTDLIVTNRHIFFKKGFLDVNIYGVSLQRVASIDVDQTLLGRILGYGTITVDAFSSDDIPPINPVSNPYRFFYHAIREGQNLARGDGLSLDLKEEIEDHPQKLLKG